MSHVELEGRLIQSTQVSTEPRTEPLVRTERLTKVFFTREVETHAVSEVSLEIRRGEFVAIAGPSGCGKTTLLCLLGLLDRPTSGCYFLEGRSVAALTLYEHARMRNRAIGFIFQTFNLIGDLTVYQNVELPLSFRRMAPVERRRLVLHALEVVEMSHRMNHYPWQLSGGQQQRVAVARAVVGEPLIILADEPTGNLDSASGTTVMELLRDLHNSGATVCLVTHDPRYARFAQRTIYLFDGRVVSSEQTAKDGVPK